LIVPPITFNAFYASSLILGLVSEITFDRAGTINGKQADNYLGEQYAMFPNAQILANLALQLISSFWIPDNKIGNNYLTP
jgi:hypothetical protein